MRVIVQTQRLVLREFTEDDTDNLFDLNGDREVMRYLTGGRLIDMGFTDLGVTRVFGHTMAVNTASRRVLEKCGLTLVGTTRYNGPDRIAGSEHGAVEYALTRAEWEARKVDAEVGSLVPARLIGRSG